MSGLLTRDLRAVSGQVDRLRVQTDGLQSKVNAKAEREDVLKLTKAVDNNTQSIAALVEAVANLCLLNDK